MSMKINKICVECSKKQESCCNTKVPITIDDIERLTSIGLKKEYFLRAFEHSGDDLTDEDKWWTDSFIKIKNRYYRLNLNRKKDGLCVFLIDGKGCKLGDNRPYICKLFPFWHDGKKISYNSSNFCIFERNKVPIKDALKTFGETEESIKFYCEKIREDCVKNKVKHEKMIKELLKRGNECIL